MHFLKIKVYRNNFIISISSLLIICIVLGYWLCGMVINDQVQKNDTAALNTFNRIESSLDLTESKIDNYVLYLYSNKALLRDFLRFFGNDAETYLTLRLDSQDAEQDSFLDDLQQFVANNQYAVKETAFQSSSSLNLMYFMENQGTALRFRLPRGSSVLSDNDIGFGYIYTRELMNPQKVAQPLGEIRFVINAEKAVKDSADSGIGKIAVMSEKSALYYPAKPDAGRKDNFEQIYRTSGTSRGRLHNGLFNTLYYSVFDSKTHGYKYVSTIGTWEIVENNQSLFILIIAGIFFIFTVMTVVIAAYMTRDARYLSRMLDTIGEAKKGNFHRMKLGRRDDELYMIAQELNDMYTQLNSYIETEYKLKLEQKNTEMKMLQRQVNPHFLYNTLEIIRSCALVNRDDQVADAIANLGAMFRDVVKREDVIAIEQELEILSRYLKIMEFKFAGSFYYQIDVPEEIRALKTVKLWLQPLCENFFVHGYDKSCEFNLLIVRGKVEAAAYVIEVSDNGQNIEPDKLAELNHRLLDGTEDPGGSIGLINVCTRLRYFYNNRLTMKIFNNTEAGVTVSVRIGKEGGECTD